MLTLKLPCTFALTVCEKLTRNVDNPPVQNYTIVGLGVLISYCVSQYHNEALMRLLVKSTDLMLCNIFKCVLKCLNLICSSNRVRTNQKAE